MKIIGNLALITVFYQLALKIIKSFGVYEHVSRPLFLNFDLILRESPRHGLFFFRFVNGRVGL